MEALRVCPYRFRVATTYRIPTLTSRREYFRLPYPVTTGATLSVEGTNYKVGEVSERGLRIVSDTSKFSRTAASHQDVSRLEATARLIRPRLLPELRKRGVNARQQRHTIRHIDHVSG